MKGEATHTEPALTPLNIGGRAASGVSLRSAKGTFGQALLFRRFLHLGLRQTSQVRTLGRFGHVICAFPKAVVRRRSRGAWLRMTSYVVGQAVGSARNRVWRVS